MGGPHCHGSANRVTSPCTAGGTRRHQQQQQQQQQQPQQHQQRLAPTADAHSGCKSQNPLLCLPCWCRSTLLSGTFQGRVAAHLQLQACCQVCVGGASWCLLKHVCTWVCMSDSCEKRSSSSSSNSSSSSSSSGSGSCAGSAVAAELAAHQQQVLQRQQHSGSSGSSGDAVMVQCGAWGAACVMAAAAAAQHCRSC